MNKYWYNCCGFVKMPLGGDKISEIVETFSEEDKLVMTSLFGENYDKPLELNDDNRGYYERFKGVLKWQIESVITSMFQSKYSVDYETIAGDGGYTNIYGEWVSVSNDNELYSSRWR